MQVLIRRSGTLIDISPDGTAPLDPRLIELLYPKLTYDHKTLLRGHDRFTPDGQTRNMDIETKRMFQVEQGRLLTSYGFLTTICETLQQHGVKINYLDLSPAKEDPRTYEPDWDNVRRLIQFRPKQEECLWYIAQNDIGLVNAATGFGKTYMFEAVCHLYPRARVDIVVKPKDVASRIVRQLSRTVPNVGQIGGGRNFVGDRVTVYTAGSVHRSHGDADILLADEAHLLMTGKTSADMARAYRFSRNFGFTATPEGRLDGADAQLEMFFGRQIFRLTYDDAVALGLVVPITVRWLPIRLQHNPCGNKTDTAKMRWGIWRNEERNQIIAADVRENFGDPDTQVLILVATIDHAIHLWKYLPEFAMCYGSFDPEDLERYQRNHLLPPGFRPVTPEIRNNMREQFSAGTLKKVIATDVWATGVDFENLQVLYRVDARASEILDTQAPGRVSRISDGKERGYVIDCYDAFDKSLKRKSDERRRHYRALGWDEDFPGRRQISHA